MERLTERLENGVKMSNMQASMKLLSIASSPSRTSWATSMTWIGCGSWCRRTERDGAW